MNTKLCSKALIVNTTSQKLCNIVQFISLCEHLYGFAHLFLEDDGGLLNEVESAHHCGLSNEAVVDYTKN